LLFLQQLAVCFIVKGVKEEKLGRGTNYSNTCYSLYRALFSFKLRSPDLKKGSHSTGPYKFTFSWFILTMSCSLRPNRVFISNSTRSGGSWWLYLGQLPRIFTAL